MFNTQVYLDNSAATRLDERVLDAMTPYFFETYSVATSEFAYSMSIEAKEALENSRNIIASKIGCLPEEVIFTSGQSESDNTAIKGVADALSKSKGKHIITSKIEDFSVLNTIKRLEREGFEVTYLDVDKLGFVNTAELASNIRADTILVSIQYSNQEIGTIQNIEALSGICRDKGVIFHTDATHAFMRTPIDLSQLSIDLMTFSAHTIHGPKGVGGLYIRKDTPLKKLIDGGFQEFNMRAGTENIPGIVGFAKATELITAEENTKLKELRDHLIERILREIPSTSLNGDPAKRLPQNTNITFHYVEGESITLHLDMYGFAVSTGSACFSKSLEASHVILAIGGGHENAHGSIRFSLSRYTALEDIDRLVDTVSGIVENLRKISPLGKTMNLKE